VKRERERSSNEPKSSKSGRSITRRRFAGERRFTPWWTLGGPSFIGHGSALPTVAQRSLACASREELPRALIAGLLLMSAFPAAAGALPPRRPSAVKTRTAIGNLRVARPLSMKGYSRPLPALDKPSPGPLGVWQHRSTPTTFQSCQRAPGCGPTRHFWQGVRVRTASPRSPGPSESLRLRCLPQTGVRTEYRTPLPSGQ
jgi:hypothetical protein